MPKEKIDDILEQKFMTAAKFSLEIEKLMKDCNGSMNYIECIVHFCGENNIEIETASKMITKPLKEKIKLDAQKLNYIKRSSRAKLLL
jgi:hypothetical protein